MPRIDSPGTLTLSPGADGRPLIHRYPPNRRNAAAREMLRERVLAEFREMPCLRLTPAQAQRLFGLRADVGTRILDTLVKTGHLRRDPDGRVTAASIG